MFNYLSRFIPNLAELTIPIRNVVKRPPEKKGGLKTPKLTINDKSVKENFEKIRQMILNDPKLKGIDPRKPVVIRTDASEIAGGAVLMQYEKDLRGIKMLKPKAYYSITFTKSERNWKSIPRKEALVIRKAIEHFKKDIKCLKPGWITIQTDSQAIKDALKKPKQHDDEEIQYAAYEVNQIFANIEHIKGKDNYIADFLSGKDKTQKITKPDYKRILVTFLDKPYITAQ